MKIIRLIISLMFFFGFALHAQTVSLVAESKNNLCLLNHEVVESFSFTAFRTEKISKAFISPDLYPEAVFVANNFGKLLIATNLNSFTSPQYNNFQTVLTRPKLNFGNAVVADMNNDGAEDIAASNSSGDVYTCRRIVPSVFNIDSIPLTLTLGGHNARLYITDLDNDPLPELLTIGAYTTNPFGYRFGLYANNSTTASTTLSFSPLNAGYIATVTSLPGDNFSACTADLNNNGRDEVLFVSDLTTSSITILYSSLTGNLDLKNSYDLGVSNLVNKKIMYTDINSDGQKEVVLYGVVSSLVHFIYIYSANFTGSSPVAPTLQKIISLPGPISDFDFADLNMDTVPDLITSVANSSDIHVFIAKDQVFNFATTPISFTQPLHANGGLALFDTDDNKRTDILSFSTNTVSSISLLKNYTYRDTLYAIPTKSILCPGESVTLLTDLKGYGGLGYYSTYSPSVSVGANSHTTVVSSAGVYSTSVTYSTFLTFPGYPVASTSCMVTSNTVQIKAGLTPTIVINGPTSICHSDTVFLGATGANSYTWSTGQVNTPSITASPTAALQYTVYGRGQDGCVGSSSGTLNVAPDFTPSITSDKNHLCRYEKTVFIASGGSTYTWSGGQTTPTIQVVQTGTVSQAYTVVAMDASGCSKLAYAETVFNDKCNEVIIKNGITPNGDGNNDFFFIENIDRYPNNQVSIFTRWGTELYTEKGYDNSAKAWPSNSSKLSPGTYYYVIDLGNGDPIRKGWVEILSN